MTSQKQEKKQSQETEKREQIQAREEMQDAWGDFIIKAAELDGQDIKEQMKKISDKATIDENNPEKYKNSFKSFLKLIENFLELRKENTEASEKNKITNAIIQIIKNNDTLEKIRDKHTQILQEIIDVMTEIRDLKAKKIAQETHKKEIAVGAGIKTDDNEHKKLLKRADKAIAWLRTQTGSSTDAGPLTPTPSQLSEMTIQNNERDLVLHTEMTRLSPNAPFVYKFKKQSKKTLGELFAERRRGDLRYNTLYVKRGEGGRVEKIVFNKQTKQYHREGETPTPANRYKFFATPGREEIISIDQNALESGRRSPDRSTVRRSAGASPDAAGGDSSTTTYRTVRRSADTTGRSTASPSYTPTYRPGRVETPQEKQRRLDSMSEQQFKAAIAEELRLRLAAYNIAGIELKTEDIEGDDVPRFKGHKITEVTLKLAKTGETKTVKVSVDDFLTYEEHTLASGKVFERLNPEKLAKDLVDKVKSSLPNDYKKTEGVTIETDGSMKFENNDKGKAALREILKGNRQLLAAVNKLWTTYPSADFSFKFTPPNKLQFSLPENDIPKISFPSSIGANLKIISLDLNKEGEGVARINYFIALQKINQQFVERNQTLETQIGLDINHYNISQPTDQRLIYSYSISNICKNISSVNLGITFSFGRVMPKTAREYNETIQNFQKFSQLVAKIKTLKGLLKDIRLNQQYLDWKAEGKFITVKEGITALDAMIKIVQLHKQNSLGTKIDQITMNEEDNAWVIEAKKDNKTFLLVIKNNRLVVSSVKIGDKKLDVYTKDQDGETYSEAQANFDTNFVRSLNTKTTGVSIANQNAIVIDAQNKVVEITQID